MSKNTPISPQQLNDQADALWAKLDDAQKNHLTNLSLKKSVDAKFWDNYEVLLLKAKKNGEELNATSIPSHAHQTNLPMQLRGIFMADDQRLKPFKQRYLYTKQIPNDLLRISLAGVFVAINIPLSPVTLLSFASCSTLVIAFKNWVKSNPLEDTVIEIQANKIIKRGPKQTTATIELDKIDKIKEGKLGLMVHQKGWKNKLSYWLSENNFISNSRVVFIPRMIESYEEIKLFLEEKLTLNQARNK